MFSLRLLLASLIILPTLAAADSYEICIQQQFAASTDHKTVGDIRRLCTQRQLANHDVDESETLESKVESSALTKRLALEQSQSQNPFTLLPHKPNYIILSNNLASPNAAPFEQAFPDKTVDLQPWETKFQISLKVPIVRGLFDGKADLFAAYTNRSFWQQFNKAGSSPFRDSNHEPELWLSFKNDYSLLGFQNSVIRTGIVHQSNGQSGSLSRSWNRVYADFIFEKGDWYFSLKPWWRIPESRQDDDNRDIDDYMGNVEFGALYKKGSHTFDLLTRNNLRFGDNHGAIQLGWSFPITSNVRGYLQWFNGYGESLIDYDAHSNSIGFGIQLSDWL